MTEPIKLPPGLLAVTLVREGVNKHRARDIEQWMNEKMAQAVEQNTAELLKELTILQRWYEDVLMRAEKAEAERLREVAGKALTDEEIRLIVNKSVEGVTVSESVTFRAVARAIERALKETK